MNFYPFHPGDYMLRTGHLSVIEDLAYRRLLDLYYINELPLQGTPDAIAHSIRMLAHVEDVSVVLEEFFVQTTEGYRHRRADHEIAKYLEAKKAHWGNSLSKAGRCAIQASRAAAQINATPKWLTEQQRSDIVAVYEEAALKTAETGVRYEVDHIVPLRGVAVCGLHVAWNLRAIPAHQNRQKSNSLEVL